MVGGHNPAPGIVPAINGIFSKLFPGISCNLPEQSPTSRPSSYRDPILVILEGDRSAPQKHGLKAPKRDCWF